VLGTELDSSQETRRENSHWNNWRH